MATQHFKQCSARVIRWESIGLLVGHDSLLLNLRCNARDSRLYPEGLKRGGFELSGDVVIAVVVFVFVGVIETKCLEPLEKSFVSVLQRWGSAAAKLPYCFFQIAEAVSGGSRGLLKGSILSVTEACDKADSIITGCLINGDNFNPFAPWNQFAKWSTDWKQGSRAS